MSTRAKSEEGPPLSLDGKENGAAVVAATLGRTEAESGSGVLIRSFDGRPLWCNARYGAIEVQLASHGNALSGLFAAVSAPAQGELASRPGVWFRWRMLFFDWPDEGQVQFWTFDDISHEVEARQALEEARGRLRLLSAHIKGILFEFDAQARFVRVWASDSALLLRPESELLGRNLIEALGPELGGWHHDRVCHTLRTGEDQHYEYELEAPNGATNFACTSVAVPSPDGAGRGAVFWIRDVTEQVQLRSKLQRADRLAAVGTLAAGVAHEVNNPLGYMRLNLEHALRELRALSADAQLAARVKPLVRPLEMVHEGVERVHTIVSALLNLARPTDSPQSIDVRQTLERCLEVAERQLTARIRVQRDYGAVPRVTANDVRLIQVFSNLITNAADAMSDAKTDNVLCVRTRTGSSGRAVVEIQDTGTGIPREHLQRVFDPFFTTKANGLGLGLAICQRIVLSVGGEIDVESSPGEGTLFRISLPPEPPAPGSQAPPHEA